MCGSAAFVFALVGLLGVAGVGDAAAAVTVRVSVSSTEQQANSNSWYVGISADGRYVAFVSRASNLVAGDTNGEDDVFVRDRVMGVTERVSVSSNGSQGNNGSGDPVISADGRFVAFTSVASNLVVGDTNGESDVFVRDRRLGTTERVSVSSTGLQATGGSFQPAISANGQVVAFASGASNLAAGDTNHRRDVFVRDRATDTTQRVSVSVTGAAGRNPSQTPAISADGRLVAFESLARNLVIGDTNHVQDVFVRNLGTGTTERVSVSSNGTQGGGRNEDPAISADGRLVTFSSESSNLVRSDTNRINDVFVHNRVTGKTQRISISTNGKQGHRPSFESTISRSGRFVAFFSWAVNLVRGDTNHTGDVFLRDRTTGITRRVSVSSTGEQANDQSQSGTVSADGRIVAFFSFASNLVAGDTNDTSDVFVRDRHSGSGAGVTSE
jgi:Tol biopolymer transport system component